MLKNHQKELIESIIIFLDNILKINRLLKNKLLFSDSSIEKLKKF